MKHRTKKIISYIVTLTVIIAAGLWVASKFIHLGSVEYTDNAQICRRVVPVNSRIHGYVKEIRYTEYQPVKKGDTLVIIDDSELRLSLARARADLANALAGRTLADSGVSTASATVTVSEASIAEARVLMDNARTDLERYTALLAEGAVTRREYERVQTDYEAKKARYDMLTNSRSVSSSAEVEARQRIAQTDANIELAEALVKTAQLNLSYTVVTAPCDGYTSRRDIQVGQLVQSGQTLLDIVDADDVWVEANFKETQLKNIHVGSRVRIRVDAIPDSVFGGTVIAISTATGSALSVMPQDNSAGNFVKVRQRIPVRIDFDRDVDASKFGAGMNVECEVLD